MPQMFRNTGFVNLAVIYIFFSHYEIKHTEVHKQPAKKTASCN